MTYIIVPIAMVVIFILIFVAFSVDDREDGAGYLAEGDEENEQSNEEVVANEQAEIKESENNGQQTVVVAENSAVEEKIEEKAAEEFSEKSENDEDVVSMFQQIAEDDDTSVEQPAEEIQNKPVMIHSIARQPIPEKPLLEVGTEDDLRLRLNLKKTVAKPTSEDKFNGVAVVVNIRVPDEVLLNSRNLVKIVSHAEQVFDGKFAFDFDAYQASQFNKLWVFTGEGRESVVEALIVAYEATIRFRKALEKDELLKENNIKLGVGVSAGQMSVVGRGTNSDVSVVGQAPYIAETLSELTMDFDVYCDAGVYNLTLPFFDFREWKPTVIRQNLQAMPLFQLLGWNSPEEVATYAKHESAYARRAVAVAFRYLDMGDDFHPIIDLLSDKNPEVVLEAVETARILGNERLNGALKMRLPDIADPEVKGKIIEALGTAGNSSLIPVVLASTKDSSWKVRLAATNALFMLADEKLLQYLEPMLNDPDSIIRVTANCMYYLKTSNNEYFDKVAEYLTDPSRRTRVMAVDCLLGIGTDKALKIITSSFESQELDLQKHILNNMVNSKSKILYQCFLTLFKNSNETLRPLIVEAVRKAGIVN